MELASTMTLVDWITPATVTGAVVALFVFTHKQSAKIGRLEGKMDTICDNVSKLIDRIDNIIDKKSS